MKNSIPAITLLLCIAATPVAAYQYEATLNYAKTDTEYSTNVSPNSETDRLLIGGTYYTTPLDSKRGPLALAAFLGRNSNIHASYSKGDFETSNTEVDVSAFNLGGNLVNKETGWFTHANATKVSIDTNPSTDTDSYHVSVGKYFAPTSTVEVGLSHTNNDNGDDTSIISLSNFHAQALNDKAWFDAGVRVGYVDTDNSGDGYVLELGSTYYPNKRLGVGLRGSYSDVGNKDSLAYGVSAEYFPAKALSVSAAYTITDSDAQGFNIDTDTFQIGIKQRF